MYSTTESITTLNQIHNRNKLSPKDHFSVQYNTHDELSGSDDVHQVRA